MRSRPPLKIVITTGDFDGVGFEVTEKAFFQLGPQNNSHFLIWRSPKSFPRDLRRIQNRFKIVSFDSPEPALSYFKSPKMTSRQIVEIISHESPALWVETTARWCHENVVNGMVTGPLSKTEIYRSGLRDMGHTDILKRISGVKNVHMGFIGNNFNVVLATAHIPLSEVSSSLSYQMLMSGITAADHLRKMLSPRIRKKPIGLLGLNPHAGESGLIGDEELTYFTKTLHSAKKRNLPVVGPLVPDAAFLQENWQRFSVYLAMYHDQGLIPFKAIHGKKSGVHVTLGIPFVRTSVDHGTAKDLFKKNKAVPNSMIEAIQTCLHLAKSTIN